MGNAPVLPALASKAAHVGVHILQEEAPGCAHDACSLSLGKQLDEGDNVGGVNHVGLLHNRSHTGVHLNHLLRAALHVKHIKIAGIKYRLDVHVLLMWHDTSQIDRRSGLCARSDIAKCTAKLCMSVCAASDRLDTCHNAHRTDQSAFI